MYSLSCQIWFKTIFGDIKQSLMQWADENIERTFFYEY